MAGADTNLDGGNRRRDPSAGSASSLQLSLFDTKPATSLREPEFVVRKSGRARRLSIKVFPRGRVEVIVPKRTSARSVQQFVAENTAWIEQARASFAASLDATEVSDHASSNRLADPGNGSLAPPERISLPAIGRELNVRYRQQPDTSTVQQRRRGDTVTLRGLITDDSACIAGLKRCLAGVARKEFEPRLRALSAETGLDFKRIHIRLQRSCWGSHSCSGTISLNLCLLFLEPELLRYLLVHELSHAKHMNHSAHFWRLVESHEPDYRELDRRLGESWRAVPAWLGIY